MHEICSHCLLLSFQGLATGLKPTKGILQGGSHSAQVFAILIEHIFQSIHAEWDRQFPGEVGAWAFIDDCMLVFNSWEVARA